jgi:molybdate transport system ATP-binding protein
VHDNLRFASRRVKANEVTISEQQAIDMLDLAALLGREIGDLSGGEQQRVAMARALCSSPGLLLMDEPVSALDQDSKATILPYIESLTRALDLPMIYVSHSLNEVAMIADHLVMMSRQGIVGSGDIQSMLTRLDMPLAQEDDAESMISARVSGYDSQYGLTYLDSDMGRFTVANRSLSEGARVRLRVAARDVSLTLTPQTDTSILNIFPATIVEVLPYDASQLIVKLSAGGVPVLARVTRKSAASLKLASGKPVYIQVKSIAVF